MLGMITDQLDYRCEVSWPCQINRVNRAFVHLHDFLETIDFRVEDISVESETVGYVLCWGNYSTVTEYWYKLIRIIVLKNITHHFDCVQVLILVHVKVM